MPNGLANLTRSGGDRYADKRKLLSVIAAALEVHLTDAEVRRWAGIEQGGAVPVAKRKRMAKQKAVVVYEAMIAGMIAGACEPLESWEQGQGGSLRKVRGGVNFGGVLKFGQADERKLKITARDVFGEDLEARGIVPYQLEVAPNGWVEVLGHMEWVHNGTLGADGVTRAWFYDEPNGGRVERVKWDSDEVITGARRLKVVILDLFWTELNGLTWENLGNL